MGMLDQEIMFSDGQAVTVVGDTPSTNIYDNAGGTNSLFNNGQGDNGLTGEMLWVQVVARTAPTSAGAATVQAVLQNSADNATWVDVVSGTAYAYNALPVGFHLLRVQPPVLPNPGMLRYWRIVYRIAGAALTGGTFDGYVSNTLSRNIARSSGFTV